MKKFLCVLFIVFSINATAAQPTGVYTELSINKRSNGGGNELLLGAGYKDYFCCNNFIFPSFWAVGIDAGYGKVKKTKNRYIGLNPYGKLGLEIDYFDLSIAYGYNFFDFGNFNANGHNFTFALEYNIDDYYAIGFKHKIYSLLKDTKNDTRLSYHTNGLNFVYRF